MALSRLVQRSFAAVGLCSILFGGGHTGWAATNVPSPPSNSFQWNVMLGDWQVLGPIAKINRGAHELDRVLVPDEAHLRPGDPITIAGQEFAWRTCDRPLVNFLTALPTEGQAGRYALAYAWTEFTSDDAQEAVLAIGHDDGVLLWLNGAEIYRNEANSASKLDQATVKVSLKQGRNTLLAKVSQAYGAWDFFARLRPAGLDEPLISVVCEGPTSGDLARLPTLDLELLDEAGNVIDSLRSSGGRAGSLRYTVYTAEPDPAPAKARIHYAAPGFKPFDRTYDWSELREGNVSLPLEAVGPIAGRVVDAATGEPIADAQLRLGSADHHDRTDADGRFALELANPLADYLDVVAGGYEPLHTPVVWPPGDGWTVKLEPGGHVLRGRVLSSDGEPIAGAVVRPRVSGSDDQLTTDADGRFEKVGIPGKTKTLYPTVTHPNFVAKDSFSFPLDDDGVTEIEWRLEPAAVVTGRVTAKDDGRPLAGITIQSGSDRFSSNRVNPEARTDAEGRFRLSGVRPGPALIHAFSDDFAPAMQSVTVALGKPADADFELEPGKAVTGRVTDPQGKPVESVWIITDTWNGARMFRRETHSDADGRFELAHMPTTPAETAVLKQGYVSQRDKPFVGGEHYEITFQPVVEHTVRLRLGDTGEAPGEVTLQKGYQWQGRSDVNWRDVASYDNDARYDASAGAVRIRLDEPSTAKISWRFRVPNYRDGVFESPDVGAEPQSVEIVLEPVTTITGHVVSAESGEPLEGIMVALVSREDRLRMDHYVNFDSSFRAADEFTGVRDRTTADGSFQLPALDDGAAADLVLFRAGDGFHFIPDARTALADPSIELPLPEAGEVTGQIVVAGEPLADQPVHITWLAPGNDPNSWDLPFGFGGQVMTDGNGQFRFPGLGPGRYQINRVRSFDNPLGGGSMSCYLTGGEIVVLPGRTVTHDFVQPAGDTLTGQTVSADGQPLGNCVVSVYQDGDVRQRVDAVRTDDEGHFTVAHLQPGPYRLSAEHYEPIDGCGLGTRGATGSTTVKVDGDTETTIEMSASTQIAASGAAGESTLVGSVPPDFSGKPINRDQSFTLSEQFGKVVAIDFWATWCGPCMAVMPELKELYEKYKDSDDVVFVTVSLDQDAETLRQVMEQEGLEFPVIYESREASQAIASAFGVTGIPSSFVIGRDGRFAADKMHGSQLPAAVEAAVKIPLDPAFAAGVKPARLSVRLALDGEQTGVPGATIKLTALDAAGDTVREETIRTPGQASQFTWLYPPLAEGGEIRVAVTADGLAEQEKTVPTPGETAEVEFAFTSPRTIAGRVAVDDRAPAADMKVTARRDDGFLRTATTDADGKFRLAVMPGTYWLMLEGTDDFAPIAGERQQVSVATDSDPEPIELAACTTVTVTGTVTDEDGEPAAGVEVRTAASSKSVTTDDTGRFELAGVPSRGPVQLYAIKRPLYAIATLQDCDGTEPQALVLGEQQAGRGGLVPGANVPKLTLYSLEHGEPRDWQPDAEADSLVVFCALWHPAGRDLLARAETWADEHRAALVAVSIDWSLAAARREAAALEEELPGQYEILFAGPGGLEIAKPWNVAPPAQTYVVSSAGKVLQAPRPGTLP